MKIFCTEKEFITKVQTDAIKAIIKDIWKLEDVQRDLIETIQKENKRNAT